MSGGSTPDVLIAGHFTRDITPDGWRVGGAALYAARTASLRGLRVAILTSAPEDVLEAARAALPGVKLRVISSENATTFENTYRDGARTQRLRAVAQPLRARDLPDEWRVTPIALLAPVAREVDPDIASALAVRTLGLAAQGWLRTWDAGGRVQPAELDLAARDALGHCDVVVLSREDLTGPDATPSAVAQAEITLNEWSASVRALAVTRGPEGAELWRAGRVDLLPGFPAREIDPTGAGDVFAATLVCALAAGATPEEAVTEANQVAACSVEGIGASAIPTPEQARVRFGQH
jgi:sugar/nucleoside kinase (ribokinase family)